MPIHQRSVYWEEKAHRAAHYRSLIFGWRLRACSACSGSGYYDHDGSPPCGACDGSGKESYPGPKAERPEGGR